MHMGEEGRLGLAQPQAQAGHVTAQSDPFTAHNNRCTGLELYLGQCSGRPETVCSSASLRGFCMSCCCIFTICFCIASICSCIGHVLPIRWVGLGAARRSGPDSETILLPAALPELHLDAQRIVELAGPPPSGLSALWIRPHHDVVTAESAVRASVKAQVLYLRNVASPVPGAARESHLAPVDYCGFVLNHMSTFLLYDHAS